MPEEKQPRDYTPEERRKIYAKFAKDFTCEKLIEYIEDDVPKVPFRDVIAEIESMVNEPTPTKSESV